MSHSAHFPIFLIFSRQPAVDKAILNTFKERKLQLTPFHSWNEAVTDILDSSFARIPFHLAYPVTSNRGNGTILYYKLERSDRALSSSSHNLEIGNKTPTPKQVEEFAASVHSLMESSLRMPF